MLAVFFDVFLCAKRNSTSRLGYYFCLVFNCTLCLSLQCMVSSLNCIAKCMFVLLVVYGESDPVMVVHVEAAETYYR